MAARKLHLLEGFDLQNGGSHVEVPIGLQKLIAFLALRGPAHRAVVAGTLWPEVPEAQAQASLRTCIWRLNRLFPGMVCVAGMRLVLSATMSVDSREQEDFATRLMHEHEDEDWLIEGIASLHRGELLPGWFDDWVILERERLNQLRLHALEHTAAWLTSRRKLHSALQLALEAVRVEPLRETAHAVLMSVYLAEGNVSDAVHQHEFFRSLLMRELGVEPSPALSALIPVPRIRSDVPVTMEGA